MCKINCLILRSAFALILCASSVATAKGKKMPRPAWYPEPRNVYSTQEYLFTQVPGRGKSAEEAKTDAINELGAYISTKVESTLQTSRRLHQETENNSVTNSTEISDISRDVNIGVSVKLYAVETTEPYYDKATKAWYVCAFIDRAKAFEMIRAEVDAALDKFNGYYEKAEASAADDVFSSLRQYDAAEAAGLALLEKTAYTSLFNEAATRAAYGEAVRRAMGIAGIVSNIKARTAIYLRVAGDANNAVFAAASDALKDAGFAVSDKAGGMYIADVTVNTNITAEDMGTEDGKKIVLYSSQKGDAAISITGAKGGAAVYTFGTTSKGGKAAAYTRSKVESKVCTALAQAIREELPSNFNRFMSGK